MARRTLARTILAPVAAALLAATMLAFPPSASAQTTVTNPGFEANGPTQTPSGWDTWSGTGQDSASYTERGGRSGNHRLAHWASSAYQVETYQWLENVPNGQYTLRVWVRSSGGQNSAYIALRNCGASPEPRTPIPATSGSTWVQISVTAQVTAGMCTISFNSNANAGNWINFDDVEFVASGGGPGPSPGGLVPMRGGDVSTLAKNEANGGVYFDANGNQVDPLVLLRDAGMNYARLKVWVDPPDGFNSKERVLQMAPRIKALGMGLIIDFHYSDSWADPGQQTKPRAWQNMSFNQLRNAVYDHTYDVLSALQAQGTPADVAQIGNEIRNGMLWPDGSTDNWNNLAQLLIAGTDAARAVNSSIPILLHLDQGGNNGTFRNWFDNARNRGVPFDIIGASYYCYWHGSLNDLRNNLNDISARYNRPVAVMETSYGFTLDNNDHSGNIFNQTHVDRCGYPATPAGQTQQLRDVFQVVAQVPNGHGLGVFYWEPTWTAVQGSGWDPWDPSSGNAWENQALFDFNSRPLPAISVYSEFD